MQRLTYLLRGKMKEVEQKLWQIDKQDKEWEGEKI